MSSLPGIQSKWDIERHSDNYLLCLFICLVIGQYLLKTILFDIDTDFDIINIDNNIDITYVIPACPSVGQAQVVVGAVDRSVWPRVWSSLTSPTVSLQGVSPATTTTEVQIIILTSQYQNFYLLF